MDKQFDKSEEKQSIVVRVLLSVLRVALIIGLFFYVLYHITNGFSAELETETANVYTEQLAFNATGVIVRSEKAVENTSGGVVSYRYENGTRVNKGAKVAVVYGSGDDASVVARVAEIDKTIDFLETAGADTELTVSDGVSAGQKISSTLLTVSAGISRGDYGTVSAAEDSLLESHLRRNAALDGDSDSVSAALASLESERASLARSLSSATSMLTANAAGYFYDYADGAENIFDYGNITTITPDEYSACLAKAEAATSSAAGKIVTLAKWYFVCPAAKERCASLKEGKKYDIAFGMSDMTLSMTLAAKNTVGDDAVLVFSTNEMPSGFDFTRMQRVTVVSQTVSGYRVPSRALRVVDGTVGVYVRSGNTVLFRACDVIYESGSYSYVSTETEGVTLYSLDEDETNDLYCKGLSLYDNVIVSGANELAPDRIVN
ncbi:MAG: hypothetical protein IJ002_01435 [Clostridia bacterium]|nr:hypothetical protein [Clostridia bacterium]